MAYKKNSDGNLETKIYMEKGIISFGDKNIEVGNIRQSGWKENERQDATLF